MNLQRAVFFICCLVLSPQAAIADDAVQVGAIYGLSGNLAQYGTWASRGAQIALNEAKYPIKMLVEDSAGEATKAISAYQKLRSVHKVPIVSTHGSSIALSVKPLATRDKVLQMDLSSTTPHYGTLEGYQFRTGINASQLASSTARFIAQARGIGKIGCIYIENEFGQGMFDVFKKAYSGEIAATQTFRQGDSDFRTQILKLRASGAPAIWLVGHARESGLLFSQARHLGLSVPFISDVYSIETPDFLAGANNPENVQYLAPKFDSHSSVEPVRRFVEAYRAAYAEEPTVYAAQAYDAFLALAEALKACGGAVPECLPKALRKLDFVGASGRIKFDAEGNIQKMLEVKTVHGGKFIVVPEHNLESPPA